MLGKRFGRLVVTGECVLPSGRKGYICKCDCGNEKRDTKCHLTSGFVKSCNCLRWTGEGKHGDSKKRIYFVWRQMRLRCRDLSNMKYGGRGIKVCKRWDKYVNFLADMGATYQKGLSIERINNNKGYCPSNCKWATRKDQNKNTRSNHHITINGETKILTEWSRLLGIDDATLSGRIKMKLPYHLLVMKTSRETTQIIKKYNEGRR